MAAYAAVVSLMYIIKQIEHHPRPPIYLDKTQVESLTKNLAFLQEFFECYSLHVGYSKDADPLEMRIADAAYAAEDVIESQIVDQIHVGSINRGKRISSIGFYEDLQNVIDEMDSIKEEVTEIIKDKTGVQGQLRRNSTLPGSSRSASLWQNIMVGFDDVVDEIMDKLVGGQLDRLIIPIVGMGGIGKTTLARNIYQDQVIVGNFDILAWVTITQEYGIREILSQLLQEGGEGLIQKDEYELRDKLYQRLWGRRYLIIMDDIWDIRVWDQLRRFFPDDNNGSRVVITTRISNFELIDSNYYVLNMRFLDKDNSWNLFSKIVFGEEDCPPELEEIGRDIVENCRGLPLSIVVVGGLLAKSEQTREYWEYIAGNLNSIVNSEDNDHCLKVLHISYNQLPVHLKPCFLYMGVFLEDKKIYVSYLVRLWIAEGFLRPDPSKSLEEIADMYLKELIHRNLVLVHELGSTGNIKNCNIHDLLRDLCLREAQKERFFNVVRQHSLDAPQDLTSNNRRVVIPKITSEETLLNSLQSMSARSLISWDSRNVLPLLNFRLLRILSYSFFHYTYVLKDMLPLVNTRYLLLNFHPSGHFHSSIFLLWNLHTIIIETGKNTAAPPEIWHMPQLRHFVSKYGTYLQNPPVGNSSRRDDIVLENLQMLGRVVNFKCSDEVVMRIPNIKKLKIRFDGNFEEGCLSKLGHLQKLESFHCYSLLGAGDILHSLTFPDSLKRLTISVGTGAVVHSEDLLEIIGGLPLLEKLIFRFGTFGGKWETVEGHFRSLKFLKIEDCPGLEYWTTESSHFPRLEHLVLVLLEELQEIPPEIGEIPTLKLVKLVECTNSAAISAKKIQEEQEESLGEVDLQVQVQISDYEQIQELLSLSSSTFRFI